MFWIISQSLSFLKMKCCPTYLWVDQWPWIVSQITLLDIVWKVHDVDLTGACGNGGKQPIHWSSMLNVDICLSDANAVLVQTLKRERRGSLSFTWNLLLQVIVIIIQRNDIGWTVRISVSSNASKPIFKQNYDSYFRRVSLSLQRHVNQIRLESLIPSIYLCIPLREWNAQTAKADFHSGLLYRGTHFIYCRNNLEWRCCQDTTNQCCVITPKQKTYIWIVYRLLEHE